jgi:hypothetical protein
MSDTNWLQKQLAKAGQEVEAWSDWKKEVLSEENGSISHFEADNRVQISKPTELNKD